MSLFFHEGGARSISVFDNDIGSGSISPMIVTGGKNGDIGLHDFRYIATGKMKKQRNPDGRSSTDGDQNKNGMLWYIPKAHLGAHPINPIFTLVFRLNRTNASLNLIDINANFRECDENSDNPTHKSVLDGKQRRRSKTLGCESSKVDSSLA